MNQAAFTLWLDSLSPLWLHLTSFAMMFLEGMGIPGIPGILPMLALAESIHAGKTTLTQAILWGCAGNWLGSLAGYQAARLALQRLPASWQQAARSPRAVRAMQRFGPLALVASRTIGSLRTPVTLYAGASRYPWAAYCVYSLLGALVHVGVWQTLLWRYGPGALKLITSRQHEWTPYALGLVGVALLVWGGWHFWPRSKVPGGSQDSGDKV